MSKKHLAAIVILVNLLMACSSGSEVNRSSTDNSTRNAGNTNNNGKETVSPAPQSNGNSTSASIPDPTKNTVPAEALSEYLVKNKDEMETKYSGKRLRFEGVVKEVIKGTEKGATIMIKGRKDSTGFTDFHCSISKSNPKFDSFVAEYKEGDRKAISGEFYSIMGTVSIMLLNCEPIR